VKHDVHARAEALITKERVEGLSSTEQEWLGQHLRECAHCAESATSTEQALRSLRTVSIAFPRELARRTQFRVRLRAQELQSREPRWRLVWMACGVSWVFGATTAPYVWRGLEWVGNRMGVPKLIWEMGFGVWWALPAIVTAVILLIENAGHPVTRDLDRAARARSFAPRA
jgi:hypothetical protein